MPPPAATPVGPPGTPPARRNRVTDPAGPPDPEPAEPAAPWAAGGQLSAQALKALKGATVFIKVTAGRDLSGSGSGFLIKVEGDTGYVVTNHHVVNPEAELLRPVRGARGRTTVQTVKVRAKNAAVSAVFHSGTKQERSLPAEVLATDESRDLAVLRVRGPGPWPRPINLDDKPDLVETMPVYILGFPFGEALSFGNGNPAITINKGSVSSLRQNQYGQMKAVQIDGAINPGNSGGPVVDGAGRLVGVSVATIRGTGIGLAIAPDELQRLFEGRVGAVGVREVRADDTGTELEVTMQLIDPEGQIGSASLLYVVGTAPQARIAPKADGTFDPLPGAGRIALRIEGQKATGRLSVPAGAGPRFVHFQTCCVNGAGETKYSQVLSRSLERPRPAAPPPAAGRPTQSGGGGAPGAVRAEIADLSFESVGVDAGQVLRCVCWSPDGNSFYCLEKSGVLHRIVADGLRDALRADLGAPCSWLALSAEGPLVAVPQHQEVWVLDPATFRARKKVPVPSVDRVASAPALSVAFAAGPGGAGPLSVIDLRSGEVVRQYAAQDLAQTGVGFAFATATPDGKYLFTMGGIEQLHRFRISGQSLEYEESGPRIAQNGQAIEVSPDGRYVCLPSGGGNYGAGAYGTFIYAVGDIRTPAITVVGGAYPRAVGFAPGTGRIYVNNFSSQLVRFTEKGIKEKEYAVPGAGETRQIVPHPRSGRVLLLTGSQLYLARPR